MFESPVNVLWKLSNHVTGKKINCVVTKMLKPFFVVCYISTLRWFKFSCNLTLKAIKAVTFLKNTQNNAEIRKGLKQRWQCDTCYMTFLSFYNLCGMSHEYRVLQTISDGISSSMIAKDAFFRGIGALGSVKRDAIRFWFSSHLALGLNFYSVHIHI